MFYTWGAIGAVLMFVIQLPLCFKAKTKSTKLIPVYFVIFILLLSAAMYLGLFGKGGHSFSINELLAIIFVVVIGISSIGIALAWLVYWIAKIINNRSI